MNTIWQVTTTTANRTEAEQIATRLVERRLAACVQIGGPITSAYRWEGKLETATEFYCVAKTTAEKYPQVEQAIRELHSYQTPEIIAVKIEAGAADYLKWVDSSVQNTEE